MIDPLTAICACGYSGALQARWVRMIGFRRIHGTCPHCGASVKWLDHTPEIVRLADLYEASVRRGREDRRAG